MERKQKPMISWASEKKQHPKEIKTPALTGTEEIDSLLEEAEENEQERERELDRGSRRCGC